MSGWTVHQGVAVALDRESVDTDQIIPARFMATPRAAGYGRFLFHDLRHDASGKPVRDFPLERHAGSTVLVTRRNFGCGSSREAAVYALADFGIRAVVAPSFGDIFAANAVNNGLLPARIDETAIAALIDALGSHALPARVDLETGRLTIGEHDLPFSLDPVWREKLVNGWDDIDLTRAEAVHIAAYREHLKAGAAWRFPADPHNDPTGEETTP